MTRSQGPTSPNIWPSKAGTTLVISIRVVRASDSTAQRVTIVKKPPATAVRARSHRTRSPPMAARASMSLSRTSRPCEREISVKRTSTPLPRSPTFGFGPARKKLPYSRAHVAPMHHRRDHRSPGCLASRYRTRTPRLAAGARGLSLLHLAVLVTHDPPSRYAGDNPR